MSESAPVEQLVEAKVFGVMFVFNFISGFYSILMPFLSLYLSEFGLTIGDYGVFSIFLSGFYYVVNPILFIIVLYYVCGGKVLDRIASVLVALILGGMLGYWVGGVSGLAFHSIRLAENVPGFMIELAVHLPYVSVGQMLLGFAVLAFFDFNKRWSAALSASRASIERPFGVVVLSALYVVFGLINALLTPLLSVYALLSDLFQRNAMLFAGLIVFVVFNGACQFLIGWGLYSGKKWGWIPAFISAVSGFLASLTVLLMVIIFSSSVNVSALVIASLLIGFITSQVIMVYLLSFNVRRYFGIVNPPPSPKEA
ncbi:MAG: hypothetical protein ACUVT5_01705 [Candidatus Bathyarchaeales archaeon]